MDKHLSNFNESDKEKYVSMILNNNAKYIFEKFTKEVKEERQNDLKELDKIYKTNKVVKYLENIIKIDCSYDDKKVVRHSKEVAWIANELIKKSNIEVSEKDKSLVLYAGLLHDIKKYEDKGIDHSELGANFVKKNKENLIFIEIIDDVDSLCEIIKYHNKTDQINEQNIKDFNLRYLVAMVHDADKISKLLKKRNWIKDGEYLSLSKMDVLIEKISKRLLLNISIEMLNELHDRLKKQSRHTIVV